MTRFEGIFRVGCSLGIAMSICLYVNKIARLKDENYKAIGYGIVLLCLVLEFCFFAN